MAGAAERDTEGAWEPLTPAVFHVLLALSEGKRHGYAVMKSVAAVTEGRMTMGPGTVYGTIGRLEEEGWVEEAAPEPEEDARRRYYRLTAAGQEALRRESERLAHLAGVLRKRALAASES